MKNALKLLIRLLYAYETNQKETQVFVLFLYLFPLSVFSIRFLFILFYLSKLKFPPQTAEMVAKYKQYNIERS